ncbi:hypothetical protein [Glaciibacter superstes]|uniref:hypothetical protein n=1 Tax=Glaciibacter superstes TaxID=501023 RepID=UPI0012F99415|nr:hypothetical protein [Glaciibacter superstes]
MPRSEIPRSERDTELRRMLVATASAAPVPTRRRWSIVAPIAAFALAGALTGAVSAVALNAPEKHKPVTVDNMVAALVYDDTQLFGEPVVINGQGNTVEPLGAVPDGAVELAVAFRCADPGRFEFLVDGKAATTIICDEASTGSAGSGSYFTVDDAPAHTLTVSAGEGKRYVVWASWAARAVPLEPSPQQAAAMADGEVTDAEYYAQFDRYSGCMTAAGYPLGSVNKSGTDITYVKSNDSVTSGAEGRCYAQEFVQVDMMWQGAHQDNSETDRALR